MGVLALTGGGDQAPAEMARRRHDHGHREHRQAGVIAGGRVAWDGVVEERPGMAMGDAGQGLGLPWRRSHSEGDIWPWAHGGAWATEVLGCMAARVEKPRVCVRSHPNTYLLLVLEQNKEKN